jgi:hypothetical protein
MTPRTGLYVGLAGLVLAVLCAAPLFLLRDVDPLGHDAILGIVLLDLGALLGLTVLVVGLIMTVVTAFAKRRGHRS